MSTARNVAMRLSTGPPNGALSAVGLYLLFSLGCLNGPADRAGAASRTTDSGSPSLFSVLDQEQHAFTDCAELKEWLMEHSDVLSVQAVAQGATWEARFVPGVCSFCQQHEWAADLNSNTQSRTPSPSVGNYVLRIRAVSGRGDDTTLSALWEDSDLAGRIQMTCGGDTIPCAFAHVEAAGAMVPGRDLLLGFEEDPSERDHVLIFHLPNEGGIVRFPFHQDALMRLEARLPSVWRSRPESPRS